MDRLVLIVRSAVLGVAAGLNMMSAGMIFFLMVMVTADVVSRYALSRPFPWTVSAAESMLVAIVFLALAHAESKDANVRVVFLYSRAGPKLRRALDIIAYLVGLGIVIVLAVQSWRYAMASLSIREWAPGILPFPVYPFKLAIPVGSALLGIGFLSRLIHLLRGASATTE